MRKTLVSLSVLAVLWLSGCGYNTLQAQDEQVKSRWSEVIDQYQRRSELIDNLVNTVQGYANPERQILAVAHAWARVGSIPATPDLVNDSRAFARFEAAQVELTTALAQLIAVTENYPQLKSDQNFRDLQTELEGTENRIEAARKRYSEAVQDYNTRVHSFPESLTARIFGYKPKPNFAAAYAAYAAPPAPPAPAAAPPAPVAAPPAPAPSAPPAPPEPAPPAPAPASAPPAHD